MNRGSSRISEKSFSEGPVMMVSPEARVLNPDQQLIAVNIVGGANWTKWMLCDTSAPHATRMNEEVLERWRSEVGFP